MKIIRFTWNPGFWAYDCDSDDPLGVGTKSGEYVRLEDYRLIETELEHCREMYKRDAS